MDKKNNSSQIDHHPGENGGALSRSAQRRQREREQRYQTILRAAETLFAREGYHKAGMERIADMAEVSVGTVYFYFKNKEDLLIQLLDEIGYQLRNLLGSAFRQADMSLAGFEKAGKVFFEDFCPHYPERLAIIFRESVGQSPLVETHRKRIFDRLIADVREALERLQANTGVAFQSPLSAEVMAVCIMGMYERLAYQFIIWEDRSAELKTIGEDAVAYILGGVKNLCR